MGSKKDMMMTAVPENHELIPGVFPVPWDMPPPEKISYDHIIDYCSAGQKIYRSDGNCIKLCAGQFIIYRKDALTEPAVLVTKRERGLTVYLDTARICSPIPGLIDTSAFSASLKKYCLTDDHRLYMSDRISGIFNELMDTDKVNNICRLRAAELIMILCETDCDDISVLPSVCTYQELKAAEKVFSYSMAHINEHIGIEKLAEYTGISATRLKSCCHNVFGMPLYSFIRKEKIYRAADLLQSTERRIIDIAADVGYDNPSKFSEAFRSVMGTSPNNFRRSV